jgi:hypothetical protein
MFQERQGGRLLSPPSGTDKRNIRSALAQDGVQFIHRCSTPNDADTFLAGKGIAEQIGSNGCVINED